MPSTGYLFTIIFSTVYCFISGLYPVFAQENTTLFPSKDNTLIESPSGSYSNGSGPFFFAGRVGTQGDLTLRRALLHFDLETALPSNAEILDAELSLYISRPTDGEVQLFTLHRLFSNWGEGTSSSSVGLGDLSSNGDATWIHTHYQDSLWLNPGGDYQSLPSAQLEIGGEGSYIWSDQLGLIEDIQFWTAHPQKNFGWILLGNEDGTGNTVKRIGSRENVLQEQRPQLSIAYNDPALPVEFAFFHGIVDENRIFLDWSTFSETNNAGYEIQLRVGNNPFQPVGFVAGAGTTSEKQNYSFSLENLSAGMYTLRLRQVDFDGTFSYSTPIELNVLLAEEPASLDAYPTPFNPHTTIELHVSRSQKASIEVFNLLGEKVDALFTGTVTPSSPHRSQFTPRFLPSGVYLIKAQGENFSFVKAVTYLK